MEVAHSSLAPPTLQQKEEAREQYSIDDYLQGKCKTQFSKEDIALGKRPVMAEINEAEEFSPTSVTTSLKSTLTPPYSTTHAEISFQVPSTILVRKQQRNVARPKHHRNRIFTNNSDILFEVPIQIASPNSLTNIRKRLLDEFDLASTAGAEKLPRRSL